MCESLMSSWLPGALFLEFSGILCFVSGEPGDTSPVGVTQAYLLLNLQSFISWPLGKPGVMSSYGLSSLLFVQGTHSGCCVAMGDRIGWENLFHFPGGHQLSFVLPHPHFPYTLSYFSAFGSSRRLSGRVGLPPAVLWSVLSTEV